MQYDEVYEALAALYLRLSGYFTTGLILHAPKKGKNRGEIDWLTVRHPFHSQDARGVSMPPFLQLRDGYTDVIICEVKSSNTGFNKSIKNVENMMDALRWAGVFPENRVPDVAQRLLPLLDDNAPADRVSEGVLETSIRVRPLLCCPSLSTNDTRRWCLTGDEIMTFIDQCLDPAKAPPTCGRRYGYDLWGHSFEAIVRWFKEREKSEPLTVDALLKRTLASVGKRSLG